MRLEISLGSYSKGDVVMGLLQDIANVVGGDKLQQLANGEGNFDQQGSPDQGLCSSCSRKSIRKRSKRFWGR